MKVDEVYSTDVFNTFYIEGRYPIAIDDKTRLTLGAQYYPQKSVGDDQIGSFSTWGYGLTAALTYGPVAGQVYYTQTGTGFTTQSPYGDHPSYLNLQQIVFNTAGEKAWAIRGTVDFATLGAPGLTATAIYASGQGPHQFLQRRAAAGSQRDRRARRLRVRERDRARRARRDVPLFVAAPGRLAADADRPARHPQLRRALLTRGRRGLLDEIAKRQLQPRVRRGGAVDARGPSPQRLGADEERGQQPVDQVRRRVDHAAKLVRARARRHRSPTSVLTPATLIQSAAHRRW